MTLHSWVVFFPFPLMLVALGLDALAVMEGERADRGRGRIVTAAAVAAVGIAAFTGLAARRAVESAFPGLAAPWDGHVTWALALALFVFGVGIVRIRAVGARWSRSPVRLLVLDLVLLLAIAGITITGLRIP